MLTLIPDIGKAGEITLLRSLFEFNNTVKEVQSSFGRG